MKMNNLNSFEVLINNNTCPQQTVQVNHFVARRRNYSFHKTESKLYGKPRFMNMLILETLFMQIFNLLFIKRVVRELC